MFTGIVTQVGQVKGRLRSMPSIAPLGVASPPPARGLKPRSGTAPDTPGKPGASSAVKKRLDKGNVAAFEIKTTGGFLRKLKLGDSVCVNGVCLTVAKKGKLSFMVQAVPETLHATNLDSLKAGSLVNLEPSCRVGDELGGHVVTGHVDAVGRITKIERGSESLTLQIQAPEVIIQHLIVKGSIALDGISLTVQEVGTDFFKVAIIPYTFKHTNLKAKSEGFLVNLEADLFAKYIKKYVCEMSASTAFRAPAMAGDADAVPARGMKPRAGGGGAERSRPLTGEQPFSPITEKFLKEQGF